MLQKKKCIIILNGPSVVNLKNFLSKEGNSLEDFDIIGVNRWVRIFDLLGLSTWPTHVVIGKNSLNYNIPLIKQLRQTNFYGIDRLKFPTKNYRLLKTGKMTVYGKSIDMKGALWWSGFYAIQLALQKEYDEIHVFGFTCTNQPDYSDTFQRANIRQPNFQKIITFLQELKEKGLMDKIHFYENMTHHPFRQLINSSN